MTTIVICSLGVFAVAAAALGIVVRRREVPAIKPTPASVSITSAAAAGQPAQLPLGARLRPSTGGYSLTMGQMEQVTSGLRQVAPFPQATLQVIAELDRAESSAASVAAIISRDPALAATVLRIANCAAMGLR